MVDICEVLEHLIEEFEKIDGKNFKIYYVKVALPAKSSESDREKIWSELWGDDENQRYSEYTQYNLFEREEDTEPSHIVYGALRGTNVTEGWRAIDDTIKKTVKQLLLRRYEPESMPDSDTFLDNFSKFADTKVPIQQQGGDVYFWYEFLLKLSREQGAFIDGGLCLSDLCMSELPCATKIQGLKTDVLTVSKLALQYLLDKAEQRSRQKEFTGADRNNLSQEKPADIDHIIELMEQIAKKLRNWADQNKKLIRNFSASLTGPLPPMDYERVVAYLRINNTDMAGLVQEHYEELISCAKKIDTLTADSSRSAMETAASLVGKLRFLANRLAQTLGVTAQNLILEEPTETEPDTKSKREGMIIAHKPWYKKRLAKIIAVPSGLVLITTLLINLKTIKEWFYPPRIQTSTSKERQLPLTNENKLSVSLKEICKDIDSRPLAQQAETEKQYLGLRIKRERLKVLEVEINPGDESIYNLVLTFPDQPTFPNSKWRILCTVSKDQYPQLRVAREGMEFYLSGEIEMTFRRDRVPYIDLSNITLEFE